MSNFYHDNAQHIDNSRTIHIEGSFSNLDAFLRDFMSDDQPAPVSSSSVPTEVEDAEVVPRRWGCITEKAIEEGLEEEVYEDINRAFHKNAPEAAKRLSFHAQANHINISGLWKTDLYVELCNVFGKPHYGVENFRKCDIHGVKEKTNP